MTSEDLQQSLTLFRRVEAPPVYVDARTLLFDPADRWIVRKLKRHLPFWLASTFAAIVGTLAGVHLGVTGENPPQARPPESARVGPATSAAGPRPTISTAPAPEVRGSQPATAAEPGMSARTQEPSNLTSSRAGGKPQIRLRSGSTIEQDTPILIEIGTYQPEVVQCVFTSGRHKAAQLFDSRSVRVQLGADGRPFCIPSFDLPGVYTVWLATPAFDSADPMFDKQISEVVTVKVQ